VLAPKEERTEHNGRLLVARRNHQTAAHQRGSGRSPRIACYGLTLDACRVRLCSQKVMSGRSGTVGRGWARRGGRARTPGWLARR
jgi:hypothetical protein